MPAATLVSGPTAREHLRRSVGALVAFLGLLFTVPTLADNAIITIERVKGSVVAVGTFERTRVPAFQFRATGFAIGDGSLIATNAHALPATLDSERRESLVVLIPASEREPQLRDARSPSSYSRRLSVARPARPKIKPRIQCDSAAMDG